MARWLVGFIPNRHELIQNLIFTCLGDLLYHEAGDVTQISLRSAPAKVLHGVRRETGSGGVFNAMAKISFCRSYRRNHGLFERNDNNARPSCAS